MNNSWENEHVPEVGDYWRFTEFDREPSGLKRLDLLVSAVVDHQRETRKDNLRIIDIGCGNGNISLPLASLGYSVWGVDIDPRSIEEARQRNPFPNATFSVMDANELVGQERFDVINCSELFKHLPQPEKLAESAWGLLERDGLLLATIPNGRGPEEIVRRFPVTTSLGRKVLTVLRRTVLRRAEKVQTENIDSPHLWYFSHGELRRLLERAGFVVIAVRNWTFFFMQSHYLFLRLLTRRGSRLFRKLDDLDSYLADRVPLALGGGWLFIARLRRESTE
jgi:2-polyprenyl-3-methyl-5-hydroxy-6-metoxy-1,4-benzoquinol methylase